MIHAAIKDDEIELYLNNKAVNVPSPGWSLWKLENGGWCVQYKRRSPHSWEWVRAAVATAGCLELVH
jgi:hypothetical protein